jgi:hypothetical protein
METWKHREMETWRHGGMETGTWNSDVLYKKSNEKQKSDPAFFLNPFTICSSCNRKFDLCPFIDEETNGSYPFANGLNGLNLLKALLDVTCKL